MHKDILERDCPIWSAIRKDTVLCYEGCAFYEGWTALGESGTEDDGVCVLFNLRGLNYLIPGERQGECFDGRQEQGE